MPADWRKGVILRIPKKGALSDCNNWRGITLLSASSKILAMVIIKRISDAVNAGMRKEQAGFRKERISSHGATSLDSALNGGGSCMSISLTLRKPSTASTETVYGTF